jgi:broad specificity phosphatase PhoE
MKYLHFIRHGETDYNLQNKWMGETDIHLNLRGEQQALEAGNLLAKHGIETIYCSPLSRAIKTAEIISSTLKISNVMVLDGLRERYYAEFEGIEKTPKRITKITKSSSIESMDNFAFRVRKTLQSVIWSPSTLIVSHSGVYKCIINNLNCCSGNTCVELGNAKFTKIYQDYPVLHLRH